MSHEHPDATASKLEGQLRPQTEAGPSLEEWFEEEFGKREILEVHGQKVEVLDITPRELKHETPVLLIAGYSDNSPEQRKGNIFEMVKQGRRVIVAKSSHGADHEITDERAADFAPSILKQISTEVSILEQKGVGKVSLLGESRGGITSVIAAYLYPEKFENLILSDPGGMIDSVNAASLTLRFILAGIGEGSDFKKRMSTGNVSPQAKEQAEMGTKFFAKWIIENPKASAKEIADIARSEIYHLLAEIKSHGIGISIFHGVDDKVFPILDVQKNISAEIEKVRDGATKEDTPLAYEKIVDGFYSVKGGHGGFNLNPELYTRLAMKALEALEKKQERQAAVEESPEA